MVGERVEEGDSVPVPVCEAEPGRGEKESRGEAVVLADTEREGALGVGLPGTPAVVVAEAQADMDGLLRDEEDTLVLP